MEIEIGGDILPCLSRFVYFPKEMNKYCWNKECLDCKLFKMHKLHIKGGFKIVEMIILDEDI